VEVYVPELPDPYNERTLLHISIEADASALAAAMYQESAPRKIHADNVVGKEIVSNETVETTR